MKTISSLLIYSVIAYGAQILFQFLIAFHLEIEAYGQYGFIISIPTFLALLMSGGINNFYLQEKNLSQEVKCTNFILFAKKNGLNIFVIALLFFFIINLVVSGRSISEYFLLTLLVPILSGELLVTYGKKGKDYRLINVISSLLNIIRLTAVSVSIYIYEELSLDLLVKSLMISSIIYLIFIKYYPVSRLNCSNDIYSESIRTDAERDVIKIRFYIYNHFFALVFLMIDLWLSKLLMDEHTLSHYSFAYFLIITIALIPSSLAQKLYASKINENIQNSKVIKDIYIRVLIFSIIYFLCASIAMIACYKVVLDVVFNNKFILTLDEVILILLASFLIAILNYLGIFMNIKELIRVKNKIYICLLPIKLFLSCVLIKYYGLYGALFSFNLIYFIILILYIFFYNGRINKKAN